MRQLRINAKLKSNRGVSILFSMLLFLVCTVLGSVILTAGTAVSGRLSELSEVDQRYYSVNSTAELFREMLDNQSVTIVRTKTTQSTNEYTWDETNKEWDKVSTSVTGITYDAPYILLNGAKDIEVNRISLDKARTTGILTDTAMNLFLWAKSDVGDDLVWAKLVLANKQEAIWEQKTASVITSSSQYRIEATAEAKVYDDEKKELVDVDVEVQPVENVAITSVLETDGSLTFTFLHGGNSGQYETKLYFTKQIEDNTTENETTDSMTVNDDKTTMEVATMEVATTKTETRTVQIKWKFDKMG